MASVFDIADFFVQIASQNEDDQMTNLKLNKLLYYAQGVFLSRTGKPLFKEDIQAWPLGPVVPAIYHKYKICGKNTISADEDTLNRSLFTEEELETLLDIVREFGQYTGAKLVDLTHQPDTPWSIAREAGNVTISIYDIKNYFLAHPVASFKDHIRIPTVHKLPADWYDPEEDAEWEAYL